MVKTFLPIPQSTSIPTANRTTSGAQLFHTAIKLTFVPNQYCNLGCSYCYLGDLTENKDDPSDIVSQFHRIAHHLEHQGVLIDALLLHGAEISTLPAAILRDLFSAYTEYRQKYRLQLKALGRGGAPIHIKTNLYNFDKLRPSTKNSKFPFPAASICLSAFMRSCVPPRPGNQP